MPKQEFIDKLRELNGSPIEVLENDALMDFFEPIIRADFKAIETYNYKKSQPFDVPISVFIGEDDKVSIEAAQSWQEETTMTISVRKYQGGHFFIFQNIESICNDIHKTLKEKTCNYKQRT